MKQILQIAVPAKYFFHRIVELTLYEIQQQTGQRLNASQLKDFSFKRKNANGTVSRITIKTYEPNKRYAYRIQTGHSEHEVIYKVKPLSGQRIRLIYEEKLLGKRNRFAKPISKFLTKLIRKRKFRKLKRQMEANYIQQESHKR